MKLDIARYLGVILFAMITSLDAAGQSKSVQGSHAQNSITGNENASMPKDVALDIVIDTSRSQPYVGSGLGITAEFRNRSKKAVLFLTENTTTMTLPPEMEGPFSPIYSRNAFFTTENDQKDANDLRPDDKKQPIVVAIQPGYSYRAAWVQNSKNDPSSEIKLDPSAGPVSSAIAQVKAEIKYIFFSPGEYKVLIQTKVGVDKPASDRDYYTFSEVSAIKVASPQFVIIFGAMIGGLISWLLFPQAQEKSLKLEASISSILSDLRKTLWLLYSSAGACLLGAIVTVLLSRLSESQFLIKISVTDFWGAMVVGFAAQYLGKSILDKLIPGRISSQTHPAGAVPENASKQPAPQAAAE